MKRSNAPDVYNKLVEGLGSSTGQLFSSNLSTDRFDNRRRRQREAEEAVAYALHTARSWA